MLKTYKQPATMRFEVDAGRHYNAFPAPGGQSLERTERDCPVGVTPRGPQPISDRNSVSQGPTEVRWIGLVNDRTLEQFAEFSASAEI